MPLLEVPLLLRFRILRFRNFWGRALRALFSVPSPCWLARGGNQTRYSPTHGWHHVLARLFVEGIEILTTSIYAIWYIYLLYWVPYLVGI
jgi:hypothetical protein